MILSRVELRHDAGVQRLQFLEEHAGKNHPPLAGGCGDRAISFALQFVGRDENVFRALAQRTRGLKLALASRNALTDSLSDGQVRAMQFEEAHYPDGFAAVVGKPRTGQCAVFPVMGGQRVIALVYADNGNSNRAIEELEMLELAASQAGLAFENELLRRQVTQPSG